MEVSTPVGWPYLCFLKLPPWDARTLMHLYTDYGYGVIDGVILKSSWLTYFNRKELEEEEAMSELHMSHFSLRVVIL